MDLHNHKRLYINWGVHPLCTDILRPKLLRSRYPLQFRHGWVHEGRRQWLHQEKLNVRLRGSVNDLTSGVGDDFFRVALTF